MLILITTTVNAMYLLSHRGATAVHLSNALSSEHVVIPRTENTIKCGFLFSSFFCSLFSEFVRCIALLPQLANSALDINAELDELDREEFYRLKKVCVMPCDQPMFLFVTNVYAGGQEKGER